MDGIDMCKSFGLSKKDEEVMKKIFNGEKVNMTEKDRNKMINKITASLNNIPDKKVSKDMCDMTDEEKVEYRNDLKKKLNIRKKSLRRGRVPHKPLKKISEEDNNNIFEEGVENVKDNDLFN
jgi:hypothetical protein